ncbi:metalloregulator ArsR/SmtB family transcription factor [Bacillus inaquosorum]|uniref:ArsR/SmtB family transcription factor n=1 Tax=Bacillus inaquosorum TaxID=483913 RepID=UPI003F18D770
MKIRLNDNVADFSDKISSILFLKHTNFFIEYCNEMNLNLEKEYYQLLEELKKINNLNEEYLNFYFGSFCEYKDVVNANVFCLATSFFKVSDIYDKNFSEVIDFLLNYSDKEVQTNIIQSLLYLNGQSDRTDIDGYLDNIDKTFSLLNELKIKNEFKWIIFKVLKSPKKYIELFCEKLLSINDRLNHALTILIPFRDIWIDQLKNINDEFPKFIIETIKGKEYLNCSYINIYPTLIPYTATISKKLDEIYLGLGYKVDQLFKNEKIDVDQVVNLLKLISDKSKFKILILLKNKKLYANEIAEELNLTNATISHHMRVLTIQGLVQSTRIQNKTYYYLNTKKIKFLLDNLNENFKNIIDIEEKK